MVAGFFFFLNNIGKLLVQTLTRQPANRSLSLRGIGLLLFIPLLLLLQLIHWVGFLLDEIFFRDYRRVNIKQPVFIISIPRSGTTFLHRTMAVDHRFTTMQSWECFFAPSIAEKKCCLFFSKIDKKTGKLFSIFFNWVTKKISRKMNDIHAIRLNAPEEDYLTLMPVLSSFFLVLPFPMVDFFWDMGKFDQKISREKQKVILDFYKKMLQKHLYVHGQEKIILSKNASFPALVPALLSAFPDCRIICPTRPVDQAFLSQLSSIAGAVRFLGHNHLGTLFRDKFSDLFIHYCLIIENTLKKTDDSRYIVVSMHELQTELAETILNIYCHFSMDIDSITDKNITLADKKARTYVSNHRYDLEMFKINELEMKKTFIDILRKGWFSKNTN